MGQGFFHETNKRAFALTFSLPFSHGGRQFRIRDFARIILNRQFGVANRQSSFGNQ
jgi:hypothetical protein